MPQGGADTVQQLKTEQNWRPSNIMTEFDWSITDYKSKHRYNIQFNITRPIIYNWAWIQHTAPKENCRPLSINIPVEERKWWIYVFGIYYLNCKINLLISKAIIGYDIDAWGHELPTRNPLWVGRFSQCRYKSLWINCNPPSCTDADERWRVWFYCFIADVV